MLSVLIVRAVYLFCANTQFHTWMHSWNASLGIVPEPTVALHLMPLSIARPQAWIPIFSLGASQKSQDVRSAEYISYGMSAVCFFTKNCCIAIAMYLVHCCAAGSIISSHFTCHSSVRIAFVDPCEITKSFATALMVIQWVSTHHLLHLWNCCNICRLWRSPKVRHLFWQFLPRFEVVVPVIRGCFS